MIIVSIAFTCLCRRLQESDQQNREMMAIAGKKEETIQKFQVNKYNQPVYITGWIGLMLLV